MNRLRTKVEQAIGWIVLLLLLGGCVLVLRPFISALLWAVVLCVSSWPIYRRLLKLFLNRRTLVAFLMTLAMILIVLLPFLIVGMALADNVRDLAAAARHWVEQGPPAPPEWLAKVPVVGQRAAEYWQSLAADTAKLWTEAKRLIEPVSSWLLKGGLRLGGGLMELELSIFIAFFLFRDGGSAGERLTTAVERIAGEQGKHLLTVAGNTVRGVVTGILGTALIWLPAALWLFHQGSTGWGIFMVIWGVGVANVDNVVKPWLISQGSDLPFILIFFGVLGGALAFGFIGVFLGPTLLAVGYRLVAEWAAKEETGVEGEL
jgi:predicted PurR-regulated permease PerM